MEGAVSRGPNHSKSQALSTSWALAPDRPPLRGITLAGSIPGRSVTRQRHAFAAAARTRSPERTAGDGAFVVAGQDRQVAQQRRSRYYDRRRTRPARRRCPNRSGMPPERRNDRARAVLRPRRTYSGHPATRFATQLKNIGRYETASTADNAQAQRDNSERKNTERDGNNRISSAVDSTTLPPLRRCRRGAACGAWVGGRGSMRAQARQGRAGP